MDLLKKLVVTLLCDGFAALYYFLSIKSAGKGKSPFGSHNYINTVCNIFCIFFTILGVALTIILTVEVFIWILTL